MARSHQFKQPDKKIESKKLVYDMLTSKITPVKEMTSIGLANEKFTTVQHVYHHILPSVMCPILAISCCSLNGWLLTSSSICSSDHSASPNWLRWSVKQSSISQKPTEDSFSNSFPFQFWQSTLLYSKSVSVATNVLQPHQLNWSPVEIVDEADGMETGWSWLSWRKPQWAEQLESHKKATTNLPSRNKNFWVMDDRIFSVKSQCWFHPSRISQLSFEPNL